MKGAKSMSTDKQANGISGMGTKEVKQLFWMIIISVWLVLGLILYLGTVGYKNSRGVDRLSKGQDLSPLKDEIAQMRKDVSSNTAKINEILEKMLAQQAAMSEDIKASVSEEIRASVSEKIKTEVASPLQAMVGEQKKSASAIKAELASNNKKLTESVQKMIGERDSERVRFLKKFIETQNLLLNELAKSFETPGAEAQKAN